MQVRSRHWSCSLCSLALALSLCITAACGDDDEPSETPKGGEGGAAAKGGTGGTKAGSGGSGGNSAGTGGTKAGSGGAGGTGGAAAPGSFMCLEEPPTDPVKCGGETCTPPSFGMNTCIVPCCIQNAGKEVCGARSTAMGLTTECSPPVTVDQNCPQMIDDGNAGTLMGCCNAAKKKCGIISTLRPSCVTESMLITLPNPLQDCTPDGNTGADAGAPDAG
jgi:hypothetical protein